MKKTVLLVFIILLLPLTSVFAEEEKTHITIGIKTWVNEWDNRFEVYPYNAGNWEWTPKADTVAVGPVINIQSGKYFMGGSFLITTDDYNWDYTYRESETQQRNTRGTYSRWDADLSLGYYFHQRVGGFIGYKYASWEGTFRDRYLDNRGNVISTIDFTRTYKLYGPLAGITANYPIGRTGLTPFTTLGYYFLSSTRSDYLDRYNIYGPSVELGIAYAFRKITITAGYKYQNFYYDGGGEERIQGTFFGANYTF